MLITIITYNHPQGKQNCIGLTTFSLILKFRKGSKKFYVHITSETMCYLFFLAMIFYIAFWDQNVISTIIYFLMFSKEKLLVSSL